MLIRFVLSGTKYKVLEKKLKSCPTSRSDSTKVLLDLCAKRKCTLNPIKRHAIEKQIDKLSITADPIT